MQNNIRKSHTRTKIQLGGLLLKSGLTELLDIDQGDDLQIDFEKRNKAYILLGILTDSYNNIKNETYFYSFFKHRKKDSW
jgi:hypothetical protein